MRFAVLWPQVGLLLAGGLFACGGPIEEMGELPSESVAVSATPSASPLPQKRLRCLKRPQALDGSNALVAPLSYKTTGSGGGEAGAAASGAAEPGGAVNADGLIALELGATGSDTPSPIELRGPPFCICETGTK